MNDNELSAALTDLETTYQSFLNAKEKEEIQSLKGMVAENDDLTVIQERYAALKATVDDRKSHVDKMRSFVQAHKEAMENGTAKPLENPEHWMLDHAIGQNDFKDKDES